MVIKNREYRKPEMQSFIIDKIKTPLVKIQKPVSLLGVVRVVFQMAVILDRIRRLPEPTKENTIYENTKTLIDIRDMFSVYYTNPSRKMVMLALWKWVIIMYDWGHEYSSLGDWVIEQIIRRGWDRRPYQHPSPDFWKEPEPYGGGYNLTDKVEGYKLFNDVRDIGKYEKGD